MLRLNDKQVSVTDLPPVKIVRATVIFRACQEHVLRTLSCQLADIVESRVPRGWQASRRSGSPC